MTATISGAHYTHVCEFCGLPLALSQVVLWRPGAPAGDCESRAAALPCSPVPMCREPECRSRAVHWIGEGRPYCEAHYTMWLDTILDTSEGVTRKTTGLGQKCVAPLCEEMAPTTHAYCAGHAPLEAIVPAELMKRVLKRLMTGRDPLKVVLAKLVEEIVRLRLAIAPREKQSPGVNPRFEGLLEDDE